MGLCSFLAVVAVCGIIALEGLNPNLWTEAERGATSFVTLVGSLAKVDVKPIIAQLPLLKYLALSAPLAILMRSHLILVGLYILITRFAQALFKHEAVHKAITSKGFLPGIVSATPEVVYILTSLFFLGFCWSYCCCSSSSSCSKQSTHSKEHNKKEQNHSKKQK